MELFARKVLSEELNIVSETVVLAPAKTLECTVVCTYARRKNLKRVSLSGLYPTKYCSPCTVHVLYTRFEDQSLYEKRKALQLSQCSRSR